MRGIMIEFFNACRFNDLTSEEVSDLFQSVQKVSRMIERHYAATSLTMAIQACASV